MWVLTCNNNAVFGGKIITGFGMIYEDKFFMFQYIQILTCMRRHDTLHLHANIVFIHVVHAPQYLYHRKYIKNICDQHGTWQDYDALSIIYKSFFVQNKSMCISIHVT